MDNNNEIAFGILGHPKLFWFTPTVFICSTKQFSVDK